MPCRINVFSGQKRERSPRENPPKGDFVGFSHGDLSICQAKIRQTVAENATHWMSRTFVWRGERSPCENTKKSSFGGFSCGDLSRFRPCLSYVFTCRAKGRHAKTRQMVILAGFRVATFCPARQRYDKQKAKRRRMKSFVLLCGGAKGRHAKTRKSHHLAGFSRGAFSPFRPENTIIRHVTNQPPYKSVIFDQCSSSKNQPCHKRSRFNVLIYFYTSYLYIIN